MALNIIVTNAGRAALVNAGKNGTAPVTISHVGISASAVTPARTATSLPGEIKRITTLSGDVVAGDTIHLVVRDESNAVYAMRSFALYLADGTLFAIYGQPAVILEKSSQALMLLAIDVQFADIAATQLTFGDTNFLNPPATTERQGVVELATVDEARAGVDALRALTPAGARAAILGWLLAQDGAGSGLDADLLDGQQGNWYADIPGRLGYAPANRAGDTFTGLVTARATGNTAGFRMQNATAGRDYRWVQKDNGWVYLTDETASAERLAISPAGQFQSGGSLIWHAGNDGAGSGLDADLLDGQHGSFYADVPARLGYTPANRAGDTFTGLVTIRAAGLDAGSRFIHQAAGRDWRMIAREDGSISVTDETARAVRFSIDTLGVARIGDNVAWHAGNDGAGSGLDADLLDGQHGSYYGDVPARLGYTPANRAGDTFTGLMTIRAGDLEAGTRFIHQAAGRDWRMTARSDGGIAITDESARAIRLAINPDGTVFLGQHLAWHAGNDGAGSGLDADLLDGLQSGDFLRQLAGDIGSNGYMRLSNGLLLQWGRWQSSMTAGAPVTVTFPVAFSAEPFSLMLLPVVTDSATISVWSSDGITGTNFPGRCSRGNIGCRFFAIGPV